MQILKVQSTKLKMKASKRTSGCQTVLSTLLLALSFCWFAPNGAAAEPCKGCGHDGKSGELIPKEAPVVPETAPDIVRRPLTTGTDSTTLRTGTDSTLLQTGTDATKLQTGTDATMIQAGVERQVPQLNIVILVDCSHSMKEGLGGPLSLGHEQKMDAAKRVLQETLATIPSDVNLGLRVFGQSFTNDSYLDCQQSALLVPIGTRNRRSIIERVRQIKPFGLTPLTYGLREAANDLVQSPGRKQIILISDGAETCGENPCLLVHQLTANGYDLKVDIVGVGLKHDFDAKSQLNCIAKKSGGSFYDSNTAAEMVDSIRKIVGEAKVSGKVLTKLKNPNIMNQPPADLR